MQQINRQFLLKIKIFNPYPLAIQINAKAKYCPCTAVRQARININPLKYFWK